MTKSNSTGSGFLPSLNHSACSDPGSKVSRSDSPESRPSGGSDSVKLPILPDRSKSTSVSSLESWRTKAPRAELCKSPSCPQLWDPDDETANDHHAVRKTRRNRKKNSGGSMLPSIFSNTPLTCDSEDESLRTPRYSINTPRDLGLTRTKHSNVPLTPRSKQEHKRNITTNAVLLPLPMKQRKQRAQRKHTKAPQVTPEEEHAQPDPTPWEQDQQYQYDDETYEEAEDDAEEEEADENIITNNNVPSDKQYASTEQHPGLVTSDDRCREWLEDIAKQTVPTSGEET